MDIFKMANQIANNMSSEDKDAIENMDIEKMISHVTKNVFQMMNGAPGGEEVDIFKMMNGMTQKPVVVEDPVYDSESDTENTIYPKTRDICFDLNVDLEDFYTGKRKKLNVKRKRMIIDENGKQTIVEEKKKLIIPIEKGMKDEHQIRFEGEADQIDGYKPGDIIVTLIENEHPVFQRDGDNLIIIKNVNLYEIYDLTFDIKHLDSRILRINKNPVDALHLNDSLRKIRNEGMPIYKSSGETGDLFIRFNVVIPKSLDSVKLKQLKEIFDDESDTLFENYTQKYLLENISDDDLDDLESTSSDYTSTESDTESESSSESDVPVRSHRKK
jgi:DnaJ-class molecular chaperone